MFSEIKKKIYFSLFFNPEIQEKSYFPMLSFWTDLSIRIANFSRKKLPLPVSAAQETRGGSKGGGMANERSSNAGDD